MSNWPITEWWDEQPTEQKALYVAAVLLLLATIGFISPVEMSLAYLVAIVMVVLVSFPVHEFAHAKVAEILGDSTPHEMGRCTLNPLEHIDPLGAILLVCAGFGWARPVQWRPSNLRVNVRWGMAMVALAGPISNLVLAVLSNTLLQFVVPTMGLGGNELGYALQLFTSINVSLFVFNLLPAPPLDGSHLLLALVPGDPYLLRTVMEQHRGIFLVMVLMFGGSVVAPVTHLILAYGFGLA